MEWKVLKSNLITERLHLNRILAEIRAAIDSIIAGGAATWGAITGTLSDQTDLQAALDAKEDTGVAATLDAAHVAAVDPHPQYLTAAEGNAAYDAIGAASAAQSAAQSYADSLIVDSIADADTTHAPSRNAVFDALALKASITYVDSQDAAYLVTAQTYADGKVIDSIADSDTTHAPSRNAVFDALALKAAITYVDSQDSAYLVTAQTYADGKVIDSIADSDTTHAPSRNAVFDALALKADDSLVVHKAGAETVTGRKELTGGLNLSQWSGTYNDATTQLAFGTGYSILVYDNFVNQSLNYFATSLGHKFYHGTTLKLTISSTGADFDSLPSVGGTSVLGLGDPNADRIMFWDDSAGSLAWLTLGTNLSITGTTLDATGGGGAGDAVSESISQTGHGFSVGNILSRNSGSYVLADRDDSTKTAIGIVSAVADANTFTLTTFGKVSGLSGGTDGEFAYLSSTAGASTTTAPTTGLRQLVGQWRSATVLHFFAGEVVDLGASGTSAYVAGSQIGFAYTASSAAKSSGAAIMPYDNTIPQNTEGAEFTEIATSYTPKEAGSLLEIEVFIPWFVAAASITIAYGIFKDSDANPIAVGSIATTGNEYTYGQSIRAIVSAGSTTSRTYKFRFGANSATNVFINRGNASSTLYGNSGVSTMSIREIKQ